MQLPTCTLGSMKAYVNYWRLQFVVIATVLPKNVYGTVSATAIMVAGLARGDQGGQVCVDWLFNPSLPKLAKVKISKNAQILFL